MIRKAKAVWRGTGRAGSGKLSTDSGVLAETPYSFKTRFENEKGTNPEELIAAAHAGCFTMALAFGLQGAGYTPTELSTETAVTLEPEGQGFRISRSALTLQSRMREICMSGLMSGEGKRSVAAWPKPPRPSSTAPMPVTISRPRSWRFEIPR
jgi:lipoyl-dependent peroxiredoxin